MTVIFDDNNLPYAPLYDDHYYSRTDGRAETCHVFLDGNGLPQRWQDKDKFAIGELGFGTGLNFLQTWIIWHKTRQKNQQLIFTSAEAHLMEKNHARRALARWPELEPFSTHLLEKWDNLRENPGKAVLLDSGTKLQLVPGKAESSIVSFAMQDAWYLDGFAPAKNPDMWTDTLMSAVGARTKPQGTFASYTAAGHVRRNLERAGFTVTRQPGFGSKRHMITGVKT